MTVLVLAWAFGCAGGDDRGAGAGVASPRESDGAPQPGDEGGAALGVGSRTVEIVLEPGRLGEDGWTSAPGGADRLVAPTAIGEAADASGARRWRAVLPPGAGVARVERAGCGPVEVPYVVGPVPLVVLPYPACGEPDAPVVPGGPDVAAGVRLDRYELPWRTIEVLHELELFVEVPAPGPGEEDGPARWITLEEARGVCAWLGGRLPTEAEWRAARAGGTGTPVTNATRGRLGSGAAGATARALAEVAPHVGPAGHVDLDGNVEEWLADGTVAGGSWVSLPEELGVTRAVPASARTETIGVRCAYDPR